MATFDTNVVVRLAVDDGPAKSGRLDASHAGAQQATVLRSLAGVEVVEGERHPWRPIGELESGTGDLSDYLILEAARPAETLPVLTCSVSAWRNGCRRP